MRKYLAAVTAALSVSATPVVAEDMVSAWEADWATKSVLTALSISPQDAISGQSVSAITTPAFVGLGADAITQAIFSALGIVRAHNAGVQGQNTTIAIFDTALDVTHPEFAGRIQASYDMFNGGAPITAGDLNHGTHVAGIMAGALNGVGTAGVAPQAQIVGLAGLKTSTGAPSGSVSFTDLNNLAPGAYDFAVAQGAIAINNSWGSATPATAAGLLPFINATLPDLIAAYRRTNQAGVINVFATGNDFQTEPGFFSALPFLFPDLQSTWVAVTAVDAAGSIASFANFCGVAAQWCIAAPGVGVPSTFNGGGFGTLSGTSMATPHVTGAIALAKQLFPNATGPELAQVVLQTATDFGAPGIDNQYGWGILNVGNILDMSSGQTASHFAQTAANQFAVLDTVRSSIPTFNPDRFIATEAFVSTNNHTGVPDETSVEELPVSTRGFWASAAFGNYSVDGPPITPELESQTFGAVLGVDLFSDETWRFGAAVGLTTTDSDSTSGGIKNTSEALGLHGLVYGDWFHDDGWFASGVAQLAVYDQEMTRRNIAGTVGTALPGIGESSNDSTAVAVEVSTGYEVEFESGSVTPYLSALGRWQEFGGFTETGAGIFNLTAQGNSLEQYEVGPGVRFETLEALVSNAYWQFALDLGYAYVAGDRSHDVTTNLLGTPVVGQTGEIGEHLFKAGGEIAVTNLDRSVSGFLSFDGRFQENATNFSAALGVRFAI